MPHTILTPRPSLAFSEPRALVGLTATLANACTKLLVQLVV